MPVRTGTPRRRPYPEVVGGHEGHAAHQRIGRSQPGGQASQVEPSGKGFWVDVRLLEINGRWIASADTPDWPSLGTGEVAIAAIQMALAPFNGIVDELIASIPCNSFR